MTEPVSLARTHRLARVALSLGFAYAILLGGSWLGIYDASLRVVSLLIAGFAIAAWLVVCWRQRAWRPRTSLGVGFVAFAISWLVSTLLSRSPRISLEYAAWAVVLGALYLLLVQVFARPALRKVLGLVALGLVATISVDYLGRTAQLWLEWWSLLGRLAPPPLRPAFEGLTYGNPSAVLTITLLLWLSSAALLRPGRDRTGFAIGVAGILVLAVALLSGSRAGWLAMVGGAAAGVAIWAFHARHTIEKVWRRFALPVAVLSLPLIVALLIFLPGVLARVNAGGEDLRLAYATSAVRMFEASPLVGTGPGTWVVQRAAFTDPSQTDYYIPHAHNAYIQGLAEFGVLGAIAALLLGAALVRLVGRAIRSSDATQRMVGIIAVTGSVYFGLHNVLDSYANMPAAMLAWVIPIALLDSVRAPESAATPVVESAPAAQAPGRARLASNDAAWSLVVVAIIGLALSERWATIGSAAAVAGSGGLWALSYALASEAVRGDPAMTPYQLTLGLAAAATGSTAEAAAAFEVAANRDGLPETWLNLAATKVDLGDKAGAVRAIEQAMRLGRQQPPVVVGAASLYLRLGDRVAANDALVASLIVGPSLAGDVGWRAIAARALGQETAVAGALAATDGVQAWEIALWAGDRKAAALTVVKIPGPERDTALLVNAAFGGDANALSTLIARAADNPFDRFSLDWAGRAAAAFGRPADATRIRRMAEIATSDGTVGYALTVTNSGSAEANAGDRSTFYGLFTYRRLTPRNNLVASLPGLAWQ